MNGTKKRQGKTVHVSFIDDGSRTESYALEFSPVLEGARIEKLFRGLLMPQNGEFVAPLSWNMEEARWEASGTGWEAVRRRLLANGYRISGYPVLP